MNLYSSIFQRKSCRKYDMKPLEKSFLYEIENTIKNFKPLFENFKIKYHFCDKVKGLYHVEAPHYLIISGEGETSEAENVGFLFEKLVLWLDSMDIGSVWLGSSKDVNAKFDKKHIITLAFGRSKESVHRSIKDFKRAPIETITNTPEDICIQAAHFAPSGMNTQPWFFEKKNDVVFVYKKRLKPPISMLYKLSDIDMGIALCHYALACFEIGKPFHFERMSSLPKKSGYFSFGIIK